jgi:hypothetical protein
MVSWTESGTGWRTTTLNRPAATTCSSSDGGCDVAGAASILTQEALAQRIGYVVDTVRKIELGMRRPSRDGRTAGTVPVDNAPSARRFNCRCTSRPRTS